MTTQSDMTIYQPGELTERTRNEIAVSEPLVVTPAFISQQQQSLALLQEMLKTNLKENRDYGRIPGIAGKMLFDSGSQFVANSFNCHFGHRRMLSLTDDGEKIAVMVEVPIVNSRGIEVATGVGAASTLEVKYKYRWVSNPHEWGYDDESIKTLKSETRGEKLMYQIVNPDHDDLVNTIVKMASKRGERDAVNGLPGVASALKELLEAQSKAAEDWDGFWGEVKRLGLRPDELPAIIGTKSVKDWQKLDRGNTLARAVGLLRSYVEQKGKAPSTAAQLAKDKADLYDSAPKPKSDQAEQAVKVARPEVPPAGTDLSPSVPPSTTPAPVPPPPAPGPLPPFPKEMPEWKNWAEFQAFYKTFRIEGSAIMQVANEMFPLRTFTKTSDFNGFAEAWTVLQEIATMRGLNIAPGTEVDPETV